MKCSNCEREISWETVNRNLELASDCSFIGADFACSGCGEEIEILFVLDECNRGNWVD